MIRLIWTVPLVSWFCLALRLARDDKPPIFLAHGGADIISPPEHSVVMYLALRRAGVPAELHIYAGAAHDFGVRKVDHPCSTWTERCADWLRNQGFLASKP